MYLKRNFKLSVLELISLQFFFDNINMELFNLYNQKDETKA